MNNQPTTIRDLIAAGKISLETVGEVLDRVGAFPASASREERAAHLADLRRDYATPATAQEKKMETKTTGTIGRLVERIAELPDGRGSEWGTHVHAMVEAHDAAVARAAKVEVLREISSGFEGRITCTATVAGAVEVWLKEIAAHHGIQPDELEPEKVRDVRVDHGSTYSVITDYSTAMHWNGTAWTHLVGVPEIRYSKHDAEAIAEALRKNKNVPAGGGK